MEGVQQISCERRCFALGRFPQEERDRIASVVKICVVRRAPVQMDNVGGGIEPVVPEGGPRRPTWSVKIIVIFYNTSVLESHVAWLTAHSSDDWGPHVKKGSAEELTVCFNLNRVGRV